MAQANRWRFWVAAAALFVLMLWLLNDILLPFVVGMAVAYFLDPVVTRLQRMGLSRTWATTTVTVLAVLLAIGGAMAILPPLFAEVQSLIVKAPQYFVQAAARVQPLIEPLREKLGLPTLSLPDLQSDATQWAGQALAVAGSLAGGLARRGAIFRKDAPGARSTRGEAQCTDRDPTSRPAWPAVTWLPPPGARVRRRCPIRARSLR